MSRLCVLTILIVLVIAPNFGNGQELPCRATVTLGGFSWLNIRASASRSSTAVGTLTDGAVVTLNGVTRGEWYRGTNAWFSIHGVHNGYVTGALLRMIYPKPSWCDNTSF